MGRALGFVGTIIVMAVGMYVYSTTAENCHGARRGQHSRGNGERGGREE